MAQPCCPKCSSTNITYQMKAYGGEDGILVYCADCGAIISWAPQPPK